MTPLALPSAIGIVADTARELLDQHISEHDITWIMKTAVIVEALKRARGNKSRAARMLGIHRNLLNYQIGELHLEPMIKDVQIIVDRQLELFSRRKKLTPAHNDSHRFSTGAQLLRA